MAAVAADERSSAVSALAAGHLRVLFATPRSPGVALAVDALGQVVSSDAVTRTMVGYTRTLVDHADLA